MWPAKQLARWVNSCDKQGFPGPGRTPVDVAFYTGLYTALEILILVIVGLGLVNVLIGVL